MKRVAIIGNAGGGKSVLAKNLGGLLDLPVYQFDDLQWRPGWKRAPGSEIQNVHNRWLVEPGWIIDGWGSWDILERRFEAADTIIFVDFPIQVHFWWAAKRQIKAALKLTRGWPPEGCSALPVKGRLFKLMWKIHIEIRPQLVELIRQFAGDTNIIYLQKPREMRFFLSTVQSSI